MDEIIYFGRNFKIPYKNYGIIFFSNDILIKENGIYKTRKMGEKAEITHNSFNKALSYLFPDGIYAVLSVQEI